MSGVCRDSRYSRNDWALAPRTHEQGNVAFGLGVKASTGSNKIASQFYSAAGPVEYPADQTIQPGDGGWALLLQAQGFREVYDRAFLYAFGSFPDQGLSVSLGGRIDSIPVRGLVGNGDDDTVKRSAYVIFGDPGFSLTRGSNTFTVSVPVRSRVNRQRSLLEQRTNGLNGGGFAKYLTFVSYSRRL